MPYAAILAHSDSSPLEPLIKVMRFSLGPSCDRLQDAAPLTSVSVKRPSERGAIAAYERTLRGSCCMRAQYASAFGSEEPDQSSIS
jgi:hypothetical protein